MSKPAAKGGALSAFFKSKAKGPRAAGGDEVAGSTAGIGGSSDGSSFGFGLDGLAVPSLFDSNAAGWDDAPVVLSDVRKEDSSTAVSTVVRDHLKVQLRDIDDNEGEDETAMRKRIEMEEARKAIEAAKRHAARAARKTAEAEAASSGGAAPAAPAEPTNFLSRLAARKKGLPVDADGWTKPSAAAVAGVKDGKVLVKDIMAFPSLGGMSS